MGFIVVPVICEKVDVEEEEEEEEAEAEAAEEPVAEKAEKDGDKAEKQEEGKATISPAKKSKKGNASCDGGGFGKGEDKGAHRQSSLLPRELDAFQRGAGIKGQLAELAGHQRPQRGLHEYPEEPVSVG